jgi:hypothetical protein
VGLKLQNNKNLLLERNSFFENYCVRFQESVEMIIEDFNKVRLEEMNYQTRWNEMTKELRSVNK